MTRTISMTSVLLGGVCAIALVGPAAAQAVAPASGGPAVVEEVMVTGSRIVRNGYEAPTPTTVIGTADIQTRAPANIADYVNQLPQLGAPTSPRTTVNGSGATSGGANLLNARGLGPTRTLVLLDGRRVVSSGLNMAVDINLLPSNLVKRVDVVTGGASAAYGSDAVAGVVNFVLDNDFTGGKGSINLGVTDHNDGETFGGDLAYGAKFNGDRGHVLVSGQYFKGNGIDDLTSRSWYTGFRQIANPAFVAGGNQPGNIVGNDIGWSKATQGGLVSTGPLKGLNFGPNSTIAAPFVFGVQNGNLQQGGTRVDTADVWGLLPDLKNYSLFSRVSYEVTDNINAHFEGSYGNSKASNFSAPYYRQGDITVSRDNPYLPASVVAQMTAAGVTSFQMGRLNYDIVDPGGKPGEAGYGREQTRFMGGLDGSFGKSGKWNAYYQHGETDVTYTRSNNVIVSRYNQASDVVANPAAGGVAGIAAGTPVCRSSLTAPTNGCIPMNLFGAGSPSQAAVRWVTGVSDGLQARQDLTFKEDVVAADAQYEPFNTWAGPVSVAAGFEWRKEQFTATGDATSLASQWYSSNFQGAAGEYNVKEFFGETIVPLLKDAPFAKSLDFNGAVRRTDYSTSGKVTTWKAGLTWALNDDLNLRGTRSRDIRAPNLGELFNPGSQSVNDLRDSSQAGRPLVSTKQINGGNPNLKPEIAKTWTFGGSYRPSFAPGLGLSIDYYKISVADAIVSIGAQSIIDTCYGAGVTQNTAVCDSIIKAAGRADLVGATILTGGVNAQKQTVEGIDYELSYRTDVERFFSSVPGSLDFRVLGSQRLTSNQDLNGTVTDNIGTTGDGPKWRWNVSATYSVGPSRTTAIVRYLGEGVFNNFPLGNAQSIQGNHYDAVTYLDLSENFDIQVDGRKVTLFGVVENLFDKDPPPVPGAFQNYGASTLHDLIGRSYRVGARFNF